jgi:putative SOS response-associated peptidase YedK
MTNVPNPALPQWRRLAERPENRCLVPLTELREWTPDVHDVGGGKPIKGEMWFACTDQPVFAVACFRQRTAEGAGFTMVTCDPNELVAPIHQEAMITILLVAVARMPAGRRRPV